MHQPPHGEGTGKIFPQLAQHAGLRSGQFEGQFSQEGAHEPVVAAARNALRIGLEVAPAPLNGQLQIDAFIQRETASGALRLRGVGGEVQHPHGFRAPRPAVELQARPRLGDERTELLKRSPDERAQPALRQPFRARVNRRDAVEVDGQFARVAALRAGAGEHFGFGMIHRAGLRGFNFAEGHHLIADGEVLFHEWQVPPAAVQATGAVFEDELVNRARFPLIGFHSGGDDAPAGRGGFAELELANLEEMPAVLVAARRVQQKIIHRAQAEAVELRGALGPHTTHGGQRSFQSGGDGRWRRCGHLCARLPEEERDVNTEHVQNTAAGIRTFCITSVAIHPSVSIVRRLRK